MRHLGIKVMLHEVNMGEKELCWVCRCPFLRTYSLLSHAGVSEFSLHMGLGCGRPRARTAPESGCWVPDAQTIV